MRQSRAMNQSHQGRTVPLVNCDLNCDLKCCDFSSFIDKWLEIATSSGMAMAPCALRGAFKGLRLKL